MPKALATVTGFGGIAYLLLSYFNKKTKQIQAVTAILAAAATGMVLPG